MKTFPYPKVSHPCVAPALLLLCLDLALPSRSRADTIMVAQNRCVNPGSGTANDPFCRIQDAIDDAGTNDEILVEPGTYMEKIQIVAKAVTLRSTLGPNETIISGEKNTGSTFTITNGLAPYPVVDGFTITGGSNDNGTELGGGMLIFHTNGGEVRNCIFTGNNAFRGGGYLNFGSFPLFTNCLFYGNTADESGGAIYNDHGRTDFVNCTIVGNTANVEGGGMFMDFNPVITNCLIWGNSDAACGIESAQVFRVGSSAPVITYSCIEGLEELAGEGNIGAAPMFTDAGAGDYSLQPGSPCHDAGDNGLVSLSTDLLGHPRLTDDPAAPDTGSGSGFIVDIGAYEMVTGGPAGIGEDCNANGIPDVFEPDCNNNDMPDDCDIAAGSSNDCAGEGIPDECEADCNLNGAADSCDLWNGSSDDCNANGRPDSCDIDDGTSDDVNGNDQPDDCERPAVFVSGPRYLKILPAIVEGQVAIRITAPDFPCLDQYVTPDGHLSAGATFMMPHEWHALGIDVSDINIIPGATYTVVTEFVDGELSPPHTVTTWLSGDVDNNGSTTFFDILLIVQGVAGNFCNVALEAIDLDGCAPNGVINIADALRAVHAFRQISYGEFCPLPCDD
ncbi:MAG: choice-of-anchor Q domain-containing protein [Planctomycetota bacterium]|jgi:hypothetical protein